MAEELSLDNILTSSEVDNLFVDNDPEPKEDTSKETSPESTEETDTTEVNSEEDTEEQPESVGSEEEIEEQEDTASEGNTSPKFYSSIAKAFAEEGIFPDLDEESISKIETPEDFRALIEDQIQAGLDERQQRIDEALNAGVEPNAIKQYEGVLDYLNNINDETLTAESDEGENLRKKLIYQDFVNRGYSQDRATREVQKSLSGGTDIDDAKEALQANKDFFKTQYDQIIDDANADRKAYEEELQDQADKLKYSILEDKKVFGDIELDNRTRRKIYDNIAKPIYKDPDTGQLYTAIQKYEMENKTEFLKNLSLVYTLTNGFKDLNGLVKGKVRKEVKRGFKELENTLNNTARTSDGNLKYASGSDPESFIGKGWTIDA